jgi:hypothetical protein
VIVRGKNQRAEPLKRQKKLDVYKGMRHVFQQSGIGELEVAIKKTAAFINQHLKRSKQEILQ